MKRFFCPLLTTLFILVPFVLVDAGDRGSSMEVGQSRSQAKKMRDQLEKIRKESDKRAAAGSEYSTRPSGSVNKAPKKGN